MRERVEGGGRGEQRAGRWNVGDTVKVEGEELLVLREENIMGVLE